MEVINVKFEPLHMLLLTSMFKAHDVYVLWSSRADVRPSYVGEGYVLNRLVSHVDRFGRNVDGYAALIEDGSEKQNKMHAEIVETSLLAVADEIGQTPVHNDAGGKRKGIGKLWEKGHKTVRINVAGHHPLRWQTKLARTVQLHLRLESSTGGILCDIEHPWRRVD